MVTISEDPNAIHNATITKYKTLDYEKYNKTDRNAETFNKTGVIKDEDDDDQYRKQRAEFRDYCRKVIDSTIKEEQMSKTDAAKSPINRALKTTRDRQATMIIREQQLSEHYGFKTCKGSEMPDRFMKGLPSSTLPILTDFSKEHIKSIKSLRDFEALNGISSIQSVNSHAPD